MVFVLKSGLILLLLLLCLLFGKGFSVGNIDVYLKVTRPVSAGTANNKHFLHFGEIEIYSRASSSKLALSVDSYSYSSPANPVSATIDGYGYTFGTDNEVQIINDKYFKYKIHTLIDYCKFNYIRIQNIVDYPGLTDRIIGSIIEIIIYDNTLNEETIIYSYTIAEDFDIIELELLLSNTFLQHCILSDLVSGVSSYSNNSNNSDIWYYGFDYGGSVTWEQSLYYCNKIGLSLAVINSETDNINAYSSYKGNTDNYGEWAWIGGTDKIKEGEWLWFNNGKDCSPNTLGYENWTPGQPDNGGPLGSGNEHCLHLWQYHNGGGGWNDAPCDYWFIKYFICSETLPRIKFHAKPIISFGDDINGYYYGYKADEAITWYEAKLYCNNMNLEFAIIKNVKQNLYAWKSYIEFLISNNNNNYESGEDTNDEISNNAWIGGTNDENINMNWEWIYNNTYVQFTYTNWNPNEPYNGPPPQFNHRCAVITPESGKWTANPCIDSTMHNFVCMD